MTLRCHCRGMDGAQRRPGRPREWSSDTERMRAYCAHQRKRMDRLVDPAEAPDALVENRKLRDRFVRVQGELRTLGDCVPPTSSSVKGHCAIAFVQVGIETVRLLVPLIVYNAIGFFLAVHLIVTTSLFRGEVIRHFLLAGSGAYVRRDGLRPEGEGAGPDSSPSAISSRSRAAA